MAPLRAVATTILLGALPLTLACKPGPDDETAAPADTLSSGSGMTLPVVGAPVRQGDLVLTVTTTGQVRSDAIAVIRSETEGPVTEILVRPGQRVARGEPILRVDPRSLDIALAEAQAAYDQARLQVLDYTVPDSIVTGQAVTGERLRNAQIRAGLDQRKAGLERAKLNREKATVVAPFAGTIDEVKVAVGTRLNQGDEIVKIVDLAHLRIEAQVLEHDLPFIKLGGEAFITAAAMPDRAVKGRVTAILPLVDSTTRAGRAVIRAPGNGVLRPGMYADVRLEATRLPGRVVVPAPAIIERDGRPLVFVVKDGRAQWVYVTPGRSNGTETEILADSTTGQFPVAPGDTVIVEGHLTLTHDAPVRLIERAERKEN